MESLQQQHYQQYHSPRAAEAPQQQTSWLLKLPPDLEHQFFQDRSVQGVYTLLDALAVCQALLLNWHLVRKLGNWKQAQSVLLPHELGTAAICFTAALLQLLFMSARPQQYRACRHHIALANRFLRLLALLVAVAVSTPGNVQRQIEAYCSAQAQKSEEGAGGCATLLPATHAALTAAQAGKNTAAGYGMLSKAVLLEPAIQMMHANWLVPFWVAVLMQSCTFVASCWKTLKYHVCSGVFAKVEPAMTAIIPACQKLTWIMHSLGQLLDWQLPLNPAEIASAGDVMCSKPLVALTVFHVWVRLVLLVLVPCVLVYCLEFSLKSMFLSRTAADSVSTAQEQRPGSGTSLSADGSSSAPWLRQRASQQHQQRSTGGMQDQPRPVQQVQLQRPQQQQRLRQQQQQRLRQQQQRQPVTELDHALQMVQPVAVSELLIPVAGLSFVRCCLGAGLVLCAALLCWYISELGVLALLRSGRRQLVCDVQGRLQIQ